VGYGVSGVYLFLTSLSNASGAPILEASSILPVVLTGADDTDEASARLRALWNERSKSRRPGGRVAISASSVPFMLNDVGETEVGASPFMDAVFTLVSSDGVPTGFSASGVGGIGALDAGVGDMILLGDPFASLTLSRGAVDGWAPRLDVSVTGEVARAGFPVDDPILDTLACLCGTENVDGGGNGPRPNNEAGFVAAATADAYLSSVVGGFMGGGLGIPLGNGGGGMVAEVDVTMGRGAATLARREFSLSLGGSSFWGVKGWSSLTDWASREDWWSSPTAYKSSSSCRLRSS
jgi:hypothetical protein